MKVERHIGGEAFASSFMPLGDDNHKLPVKKRTASAIGKDVGDTVRVRIKPVARILREDRRPSRKR